MKINLDLLLILSDVFKSIPINTPGRLVLINDFIKEVYEDFQVNKKNFTSQEVLINLSFEENLYSDSQFSFNDDCIQQLIEYLPKFTKTNSLYHERMDVVLLPDVMFCCGKPLKLDGRSFANLTVYTNAGVCKGKSYHGKCKCGLIYYYGFREMKSVNSRTFTDTKLPYLMFRGGVIFCRELLNNIDLQISIGSVSFEAAAEIYNNLHNPFQLLNPQRLEDAWFVYKILFFESSFSVWPRNVKKELDIEKLCFNVYPLIRNAIDNTWLNHICTAVGCKERLIIIDGNEKLYRLVCNAKKERIIGKEGQVNTYNLCIRNPKRGNQYQKGSKFCEIHVDDKFGDTLETLDMRPVTRSFKKKVPTTVTSAEGCKDEKKVDRFYERTAGMFYAFRPCGVRLSHWEMYTAESLSNVFLFLVDLFGQCPTANQITGIVYDRACDLHPFLKRLSKEGNEAASNFKLLTHIVDIFHAEKHTKLKCTLSSEECKYHPHLPKFSELREMNTEIAEQSFARINPFKYVTRKMSYSKRLMFLKFLDNDFNLRKSSKLR